MSFAVALQLFWVHALASFSVNASTLEVRNQEVAMLSDQRQRQSSLFGTAGVWESLHSVSGRVELRQPSGVEGGQSPIVSVRKTLLTLPRSVHCGNRVLARRVPLVEELWLLPAHVPA